MIHLIFVGRVKCHPCTFSFFMLDKIVIKNIYRHIHPKWYCIFKSYPGGDLKVIRNARVGGMKSIKMWEEGVAQGVSKCIILNLKCAGMGGQQNWIVVVGTPQKCSGLPQCTFENGIALSLKQSRMVIYMYIWMGQWETTPGFKGGWTFLFKMSDFYFCFMSGWICSLCPTPLNRYQIGHP